MPSLLSSRRKSPVVFDRTRDNRTHYAVDVTGGSRSSAISRIAIPRNLFADILPPLSGRRRSGRGDDLRADLDQLLSEARQRPIYDRLGRRQRAQKVAQIIGEGTDLKANGVGGEPAADFLQKS
jgi:hypothetical protein